MDEKKHEHRGSLIGPVILIGLGVIFLLNNLGILNWSVWDVVFRLWPVLIVAAGLDILIGRRSTLGALLSLVLTCALIAGALWLYGSGIAGRTATTEISQSLDEATEAEILIAPAVGSVHVEALAESNQLVSGVVHPIRGERVHQDFEVRDGVATFRLQSEGTFVTPAFGPSSGQDWDLGVSSDVPLDMEINLSVGELDVDLTDLTLDNLDVSMGVGQTRIVLPDEGNFRVHVDGAIGNTVIIVPAEMELRIHADTAISARQMPRNYQRNGDVYESPGYDDAENRIELYVSQAIGNVTVREDR